MSSCLHIADTPRLLTAARHCRFSTREDEWPAQHLRTSERLANWPIFVQPIKLLILLQEYQVEIAQDCD